MTVLSPCLNCSPSSEFYAKTNAHETVHRDEWETMAGGRSRFFDVDEFFARVAAMTAPSKADLLNALVGEYNRYSGEEAADHKAAFGDTNACEKRAYHTEYGIAPVGVRERSDGWIDRQYPPETP